MKRASSTTVQIPGPLAVRVLTSTAILLAGCYLGKALFAQNSPTTAAKEGLQWEAPKGETTQTTEQAAKGTEQDATVSQPAKHAVDTYRTALRKFQHKLGNQATAHPGWNWLGEASIHFAARDYDLALASYGQALAAGDTQIDAQAHFGLANTIYRQAEAEALAMKEKQKAGGSKKPAKTDSTEQTKPQDPLADLQQLIDQLEDSLAHYINTLDLKPEHAEAANNKKIVEELLKQLKAEKEKKEEQAKQEQQKQQQGSQGEGQEGKPDQKQQENSESDKKDEQSKDGSQGEGQNEKQGQSDKETDKSEGTQEQEEGKGKEGQQNEGAGKEDKPGEGQATGEGEEGKPDKGDQRSQEEMKKAEEANQKANEKRDGQIQAQPDGNKPGDQPGQKAGEKREADVENEADAKPNKETGYSPSQARRLAARMADEARVRQEHRLRQERAYKNW